MVAFLPPRRVCRSWHFETLEDGEIYSSWTAKSKINRDDTVSSAQYGEMSQVVESKKKTPLDRIGLSTATT
jgi:hypothetical protein